MTTNHLWKLPPALGTTEVDSRPSQNATPLIWKMAQPQLVMSPFGPEPLSPIEELGVTDFDPSTPTSTFSHCLRCRVSSPYPTNEDDHHPSGQTLTGTRPHSRFAVSDSYATRVAGCVVCQADGCCPFKRSVTCAIV